MSLSGSSPVVHAPVRREVQSFAVQDDPEDLGLTLTDFWKELDYRSDDFKGYHLSDHWRPKEDFDRYVNEISKSICESGNLGAYLLKSLVV